jgi:hypothetical protein
VGGADVGLPRWRRPAPGAVPDRGLASGKPSPHERRPTRQHREASARKSESAGASRQLLSCQSCSLTLRSASFVPTVNICQRLLQGRSVRRQAHHS